MLIWADRIFDFLRVLEDVVGFPPARRHSYTVGYRSGWDGAAVNEGLLDPTAEDKGVQLLATGARILSGAGWGRSEIEYDSEAKSVRWVFPKGTAFGLAAKADGTRENPACPFMAGFIAGWTNRSPGLEIEVREVECVGNGEARCAFESTEFIRFKE